MFKKTKNLLATSLSVAMLITLITIPASATTTQLEGQDRYQTALEIVKNGWTMSDNVVIARGDDLADALAAAPLAYAKEKSPILLTETNEIPDGVLAELTALGVKNVYIVGGTGAVSTVVEKELDKDFAITRLAGANRVETSLAVANEAFKTTTPTEVVIANGYAYADALSVSSIAASKGMPILLVNDNKLSAEETSYLADKTVYAVGGEGVLNASVVTEANNATRLSGLDRYETNAEILSYFKPAYNKIYIAKGTPVNLVDALAGSALAALGNNPIVLVDENNKLNTMQETVITTNITTDSELYTLGGTVSNVAVTAIESLTPPVVTPPVVTPLGLGQTVTIPDTLFGTYEMTINSVELDSFRNEFDNSNPAEVYKVNYTYKLIAKGSATTVGLFLYSPFESVDSTGEVGYNYPGITNNDAQELNIVGSRCTADTFIAVKNKTTSLTLVLDYYESAGFSYVTFKLQFHLQ